MSKPILAFAAKLKAKLVLDQASIVDKGGRFFLFSKGLRRFAIGDFFYAGKYLGKTKKGKFFPSFNLLAMLAETKASKVVVDEKAAWLFICGRDVFFEGIKFIQGSKRKGDFTLILNVFGECLGFGLIVQDLSSKGKGVAVTYVSDVGDFLRRER